MRTLANCPCALCHAGVRRSIEIRNIVICLDCLKKAAALLEPSPLPAPNAELLTAANELADTVDALHKDGYVPGPFQSKRLRAAIAAHEGQE
jgi:hypothetical protein